LALASLVLLLLTIYVQAEASTGFYWLSSAVTYQTAFVFFIFLLGCLIRRLNGPGRQTWQDDIAIIILILFIVGSNETAAVFLFFFFLGLAGLFYFYKRRTPPVLRLYAILTLAAGGLILLSSGVLSYRSMLMNHNTGWAVLLPMILFRFGSVLFFVMKTPLFWLACFAVYLTGRRISAQVPAGSMIGTLKKNKVLVPGLIVIGSALFLSLASVLVVSRGSFPDRALNNLIDFVSVLLLGLALVTGIAGNPIVSGNADEAERDLAVKATSAAPVALALLICGLLASDTVLQAWKSNISGYFYHSIQVARHDQLQEARDGHQGTVVLPPYREALEDKIRDEFPHGVYRSMDSLLRERPQMIYLGDGPDAPDPGWKYYYGLDSILTGKP
jgi:hypothetical protein